MYVHINKKTYTYIYIYIHTYMILNLSLPLSLSLYIYIYIRIPPGPCVEVSPPARVAHDEVPGDLMIATATT